MGNQDKPLRFVTVSGSYRKFIDEIAGALKEFKDLEVKVLSPASATILSSVDGFVSLKGDVVPRIDRIAESDMISAMTLIENSHLRAIQQSDALWIVVPSDYCGISTAFEIGWALAHQVPVFYHASYLRANTEPIIKAYATPVRSIEFLVGAFPSMPCVDPIVSQSFSRTINQKLMGQKRTSESRFLNADIALGPLVVDYSKMKGNKIKGIEIRGNESGPEPSCQEILLVKTHKWGGRYSMIGGRIKPGERLVDGFSRVLFEQTGLEGEVGGTVCVFDEIPDSGYFKPETHRIFVDNVARIKKRDVRLDSRAQEYVWISPKDALAGLDLEPNARRTIQEYAVLNS